MIGATANSRCPFALTVWPLSVFRGSGARWHTETSCADRTEREFLNAHMKQPSSNRRFIVYDYMQVAGGAERVTAMLAEEFTDYRVVISRCYPDFLHMSGDQGIDAISL